MGRPNSGFKGGSGSGGFRGGRPGRQPTGIVVGRIIRSRGIYAFNSNTYGF